MVDAKVVPTEETKDPSALATPPKPKPEDDGVPVKEKRKVNRKDKNYYLLTAETEEYVDDSELYRPRISRLDRVEYVFALLCVCLTISYQFVSFSTHTLTNPHSISHTLSHRYWQKMLDQKGVRRKPPADHMTYQDAWMQGEYDLEGPTYPTLFVWQHNIVKMRLWDYLSLSMLLLYFVVVIAVYDGLGAGIAGLPAVEDGATSDVEVTSSLTDEQLANAAAIGLGPATMLLPLVFMLLLQVLPLVGSFYFITRCNDLVKYKSRTTNFGDWNFCSIFVSQAVEYFLYGGVNNADGAGKCAYGDRMMGVFGKKEVKVGDLNAAYDREIPSDDDEDFQDDPYPENHLTVGERIAKARKDLEADPDNEDLQALVQGTKEVSVMQKLLNDKHAKERGEEERHKAEALAREALCKEWTTWMCIVCNKPNRRPAHPPPRSDIFFGTSGVFYKRTFAIIRPRRDCAMCHYCGTYVDYKPPLGSGHLFPYNKKPFSAFNKYPIKTTVQAGLVNTAFSRFYNSAYSLLFGIRNNSSSNLAFNDWRLRLYLNGRFPETPRQVKKKLDLYQVGEYVECKLQKSEWSRAIVTKSRKNHTYDLRYDPGDELRLVDESEIRLPPEKRAYAYIVELTMLLLWLSLPVGILASQAITSGMITFFPFCASGFLLFLRISKLVQYFTDFKYAGVWVIFKLSMFYTLPLIVMLLASFMPFTGASWVMVAYYWIAVKLVSLPVLYVMKPHFAMFAMFLFFQTSAGMVFMGNYCDGSPIITDMMAVHIMPFCTATLTMLYYRRNFATFADVHLNIRPPMNFIPKENPCVRLYHMFVKDPHAADEDPEAAAHKIEEAEKAEKELIEKMIAEQAADTAAALAANSPEKPESAEKKEGDENV